MADDSFNTNDDANTVTIAEIIEEEDKLEADALAVLGDSDENNCTYSSGYILRQALYTCRTCETTGPVSICLACSYACHEGHDLIELYTKRNVRCDCGNSKFRTLTCTLVQTKDLTNEKNTYNQNYSGLYCTCSRPYPEPDDDIPDEMIQCVVCEDWFHTRHLDAPVPSNDNFEEMVCSACVRKLPWLVAYTVPNSNDVKLETEVDSNNIVDVCTVPEIDPDVPQHNSEMCNSSHNEAESSELNCYLESLLQQKQVTHRGAIFLQDHWRQKLCQCTKCMAKYHEENVAFLVDLSDSVKAYEDRGQSRQSHAMDNAVNSLQNMNRVVLGEVVHGYNDMKSSLLEYLQKFVENKKTVREEDIHEFFTQLKASKKRRLGTMPPSFCK